MPTLKLAKLHNSLFRPATLEVLPGETVALTGPSGSGKTSLLRAIADLDAADGDILLDDRSYRDISPTDWRRRVGLLPAQPLWWETTARLHFMQLVPANWFELLGLKEKLADMPVEKLSEGERQRFALLRLLSTDPLVLLLDEPTARLDDKNKQRVERFLLEYQTRTQACMIWVSHDDEQLRRIASRHLVMENGVLSESLWVNE